MKGVVGKFLSGVLFDWLLLERGKKESGFLMRVFTVSQVLYLTQRKDLIVPGLIFSAYLGAKALVYRCVE